MALVRPWALLKLTPARGARVAPKYRHCTRIKFRPWIRFLQPAKGIKKSLKMARALVLAIKQVLARALKALRRLIKPNKPSRRKSHPQLVSWRCLSFEKRLLSYSMVSSSSFGFLWYDADRFL